MTFEKIIEALPTLSKEQLKEVKGRITFLLTTNIRITSKPIEKHESYLRDVILLYAKRVTIVPDKELLIANSFKMDDKLNGVANSVEKLGKQLNLSRKEIMKLCRVLIESADAKIEELNYPRRSFKLLLAFMADPRVLLEESFPGYVNSSLFKAIVLK